ncbi:hypothetical protein [Tolypothrix campylonemoides]|uniref:hypothetical protein n=1 Tax=Tolypothrix campylonemoides TaxID=1136105 RepID=UPI0038B4800B
MHEQVYLLPDSQMHPRVRDLVDPLPARGDSWREPKGYFPTERLHPYLREQEAGESLRQVRLPASSHLTNAPDECGIQAHSDRDKQLEPSQHSESSCQIASYRFPSPMDVSSIVCWNFYK